MKNNRNYRPAGRDKTRPEASRRPARPQSRPQEEESVRGMQREDIVIGRNGVIELLKSGRAVESILVTGGETQGSIVKILAMAKEQGIPVKETSPAKLDNMCGHQNHQGVIAVTGAANYSTMEDIYKKAGDQPLFVIIADEITDPHNLGAIIRTAECAGAHGVIIPKRRSAGLTSIVGKTSAGAVSYLPVARVPNIPALLKELQQQGVWIFGTAAEGTTSLYEADLKGPAAIVIGSEGDGMGRLVREGCDFLVSIPMKGRISSLNASAAAAILLYEAVRQRLG